MGWKQVWRALWPFGHHSSSAEAAAAVRAATRSHTVAVADRDRMAHLRIEADAAAAEVRAHNTANHFDTWLQEVIRGEQ